MLVFTIAGDSKNALLVGTILKEQPLGIQKKSDSAEQHELYPLRLSQAQLQQIYDAILQAQQSGAAPDTADVCSVSVLVAFWHQAEPFV